MAATMSFGSLYPMSHSRTAQESVNSTGQANRPVSGGADLGSNIPVLPGVAAATGVSVPTLIALGVLAWYLLGVYD